MEAAPGLLGMARYAAVLDLLSPHLEQLDGPEAADLAARACEGMLASGDIGTITQLSQSVFEQIFALLARHRGVVGHQRVVNIEWQPFPALGSDANAPVLHAALAEEPAFFAELASYVYRAATEIAPADEEPQEEQERRPALAHRAYEVLRSWRRCPGVLADGSPSAERCRESVHDARQHLKGQ